MKTLTILLLSIFSFTAGTKAAPSVINFKLVNNKILSDQQTVPYALPLTLNFAQATLAGKTKLTFFVTGSTPPAIAPVKISTLKLSGGMYTITIDSNLQVSSCSTAGGGKCTLPQNTFSIKVDNVTVADIVTANGTEIPNPPAPDAATTVYGSPYYDAMLLGTLKYDDNKITFKKVFQYYNLLTNDAIQANPFFKGIYSGLFTDIGANGGKQALPATALQSLGDIDVTNFADGLAKFIVARMKEELSMAFFNNFKKALETGDGKKLQILFPGTYQALTQIDKQVYNYPQYMELLRESFQKDLALLLPDLQQFIDTTDLFDKYPDLKVILSDAIYIAGQFKSGGHPGAIIDSYLNTKAKAEYLDKIDIHIYPSLQLFNIFSQSLRSNDGQGYWVSAADVKTLCGQPDVFRIYLGLVYQKMLALPGGDIKLGPDGLKAWLNKPENKFETIKDNYAGYLNTFINDAKTVEAAVQAVKKSGQNGSAQPDYEDYYGLIKATASLMKNIETAPTLAGDPLNNDIKTKIELYLKTVNNLSGLYVDLYYKHYPTAIADFGTVLQQTVIDRLQAKSDALTKQLKAADSTVPPDLIQQVKDARAELDRYNTILTFFTKYGNFAATVVKAQNSDDVQKAIEAIAMPVGSASVKRQAFFNVALNAYIGPYIGGEKISGFDKKAATSFGLTAPVGVSFSWGNAPWSGWSVGGFVSLIDLGAIASYRLGNGTKASGTDTLKSATIPEVKLKNIVSPGLFLSLGFPGVPISLNFGYQLAPTLRSITVVNSQNIVQDPNTNSLANQYASKLYSRLSVSIVVDIPLVNFYTKGNN